MMRWWREFWRADPDDCDVRVRAFDGATGRTRVRRDALLALLSETAESLRRGRP